MSSGSPRQRSSPARRALRVLALAMCSIGIAATARETSEAAKETASDAAKEAAKERERERIRALKKEYVEYSRLLRQYAREYPDDHENLQITRTRLAETCFALGDYKRAGSLFAKVEQVYAARYPEEYPGRIRARINVARSLEALGDLKRSSAIYRDVIRLVSKQHVADDDLLVWLRENRAEILYRLEDFVAARRAYEELGSLYRRRYPEYHPKVLKTDVRYAGTAVRTKRAADARAVLEKVVPLLESRYPGEKRLLAEARDILGVAYRGTRDPQKARELHEAVIAWCAAELEEGDDLYVSARLHLVEALVDLEEFQRADELAKALATVLATDLRKYRKPTKRLRALRKDIRARLGAAAEAKERDARDGERKR